jgi:hypothetical protein
MDPDTKAVEGQTDIPMEALPVLSYANFQGQQPSASRFVQVISPEGVILTEDPLPNFGRRYRVAGIFFLIMGIWAGVVLGIDALNHLKSDPSELFILLFPLFMLTCGVAAYVQGNLFRKVQTRLEVSGAYLHVFTPLIFARKRRWRIRPVLRLHVPLGGPGVSKGRGVTWFSHVTVRTSVIGLQSTILSRRPKDECEWIARELNNAMDRFLEHANAASAPR